MGIIARFTIYIAPIFILVGLVMLVVSLAKPTKVITCPRCNAQHTVLVDSMRHCCNKCDALLLVQQNSDEQPAASSCPYCGLTAYVAKDYGNFPCSNCGGIRNSTNPDIKETIPCAHCGELIPKGVIYCKFCKEVLLCEFPELVQQDDPRYNFDNLWKIGKNAEGHFFFAKAHLVNLEKKIGEIDDLGKVVDASNLLGDALQSLEEALLDASLLKPVKELIPKIDSVYKLFLEKELKFLEPRTLEVMKRGEDPFSLTFDQRNYTRPRKRIEEAIGSEITSLGGVGTWSDLSVRSMGMAVDIEKLKAEIQRFTEWGVKRSKE